MTLQNKKIQLLGDDNTADDMPDIFDQYGGDTAIPTTTSTHVNDVASSQSVAQQVSDNTSSSSDAGMSKLHNADEYEEVVEDIFEQYTNEQGFDQTAPSQPQEQEKKWEKEFTQKSTSGTAIKDSAQPQRVRQQSVQDTSPKPTKPEKSQQQSESRAVPPVKQPPHAVMQMEKTAAKKSYIKKEETPTRKVTIDPAKKTIMIVDDDIDTLEMYADVFESADYNVIRAADGLEALSLLSEHTPHVIFTGIVMPRMDGFAMMESLKQNKRTADIPVVINSHLGRDADKKRAEELGAKDFIVRGFTQPREVVERIGALLLRSDYVFRFDKNDEGARKLAKDLGVPNFFHCPHGQEMVIKLVVSDEKDLTFTARFSCVDKKDDNKK